MKKYYYITLIAIVSIVCLQASYINSLYNHFVTENTIKIDEKVRKTIVYESIDRATRRVGKIPKEHPRFIFKRMEDMTSLEIDSIRALPNGMDTIDIVAAQKKGMGITEGDILDQLTQDKLLKAGFPLNLKVLDSLWLAKDYIPYRYYFSLVNQDLVVIDSIGNLEKCIPNYISELFPIGTKGLQYLQLKVDIPLSHFLQQQIWTLVLSACMMLLVLLCLFYQLTVIRRKEALLRKREMTINGTIHDLKSPLNSVITMMGWLKQSMPDVETKEMVETSRAGVKRLVSNIEALLMTARRGRQQLVLNKSFIDIFEIAEGVKGELDRLYQDKPHVIHINNELPADFQVEADSMYMENVFRNLMENSLKYSDIGVEVEVTLSVIDGKLQVAVKDNGWGIAPQYQKKLFTQFYQVPRSEAQQKKGYGIGLAQSKYIINEHGGEIKVESADGKGSTFTFTIPCS